MNVTRTSSGQSAPDSSPPLPMTVADRCDRCGAQAYVRAVLTGGGDLLFCCHHGRKFSEALRANGADIHDETDRLIETPAVAVDS